MIAIIDYGMGNPASILNMIRKVGGEAILSSSVQDINAATAIILPGVGSFDNGVIRLRQLGILETLKKKILQDKIPFLGVCLGMQLLFETSEEGEEMGLGYISGSVTRFNFFERREQQKKLRVPHMGWNEISAKDDLLFRGLTENARFYFVHSYYVNCLDEANALACCHYGHPFTCAVRKDNIYGVQFHPEKSHKFGMQLFRNFLEIVKCSEHA
ncbi:imidazole glycerol phosphate synthase subunit HisH [Fastidiosibacter lacustris]|uniref:imidazole glycerol phosphate synthase subunit HisH n=1 Tax=Fastidiosibacter lacustris TaxID=2056695 RepID=UPI000E350079|nr:imidazole glycerol phosphate synthase subunit HisH [Fastidiosibacter lacustris]